METAQNVMIGMVRISMKMMIQETVNYVQFLIVFVVITQEELKNVMNVQMEKHYLQTVNVDGPQLKDV